MVSSHVTYLKGVLLHRVNWHLLTTGNIYNYIATAQEVRYNVIILAAQGLICSAIELDTTSLKGGCVWMAPSASPTQREEMERHHNYAEICRGRTYIRINGTEKQAHAYGGKQCTARQ